MSQRCAIIVLAKAPVAGLAKTRLIPALGAEGAARLARRMLDETLRRAVEADIGPVTLCCTPDASHPALGEAARRHRVMLTVQGDGDLGARMARALEHCLLSNAAAIVIGTDCPALGAGLLRDAARALLTNRAVFAPAADGGYVLAGIAAPSPLLFDGIAWSTDAVMAQTRIRLRQLSITAAELPCMQDVDVPEDLIHVPEEWLT